MVLEGGEGVLFSGDMKWALLVGDRKGGGGPFWTFPVTLPRLTLGIGRAFSDDEC